MATVFISYSRKDTEIANSIVAALEKRHHKVVIDKNLLGSGDDWRAKLSRSLEKCDAVISLVTPNSVNASYPMSEIGAARALRKKLIPVAIGDVKVPDVIGDIYFISEDFSTGSKAAGMKRIVNKIDDQIKDLGGNVFIVHGSDAAAKYELKSYLETLALKPIILHDQDDKGDTIIEKFEDYAEQANFAFVLLTPDDKQDVAGKSDRQWRARQNVIMELGWFLAKLGRRRVVLLYKAGVEIPSDISGVLYLEFNESVKEVGERIRQRLAGEGLIGP